MKKTINIEKPSCRDELPEARSQGDLPMYEGGTISSFVAARMLQVHGKFFSTLVKHFPHLIRHYKSPRYFFFARADVEKFLNSEQYKIFKRMHDELFDVSDNPSEALMLSKLTRSRLNWDLIVKGYRWNGRS